MDFDLLNLSDGELELILNNAYAFPSKIETQIKLNLHKMIGDKKFYYSRENSLARFLMNNVPSCELVKNMDTITLQKTYSILYALVSTHVTDALFRSNLLGALNSRCYDIQSFGKTILDIETASVQYSERHKIFKESKTSTNLHDFVMRIMSLKIQNLETVSSLLTRGIRNEYFSIIWDIVLQLTDKLLTNRTTPSIFKQIAATLVLFYKPLAHVCYYEASWNRLWSTAYIQYLDFENIEFAKIINDHTLKLWDCDTNELLSIIVTADIDDVFDMSKIIQTDYINLDIDIISKYKSGDDTLIWASDITDDDKEKASEFKKLTLNHISAYFPKFKDNCRFDVSEDSLAFIKKEFPDIKFVKLIWDGIYNKNIRTIIKYDDDYYLLVEDFDRNVYGISQLDSTDSVTLINFTKNDMDSYKVISNFEEFEKGK